MVGKRVAFITVGCKLNYSESSTFAREFSEGGYAEVDSGEVADIYVINSCAVTENAVKTSRNLIRRAARLNSEAVIVVTGCWAQLEPEKILKLDGVNLILGSDEKINLFKRVEQYRAELAAEAAKKERDENFKPEGEIFSCSIEDLETLFPAYSSDERTRSFLKIQDGCDYNCSYCTIPLARGRSRNFPIALLEESAREIAAKGVKEIVLTGVNSAHFGHSTGESFTQLIERLCKIDDIERIRISSMEPNLLSEEIIDLYLREEKLLPHFHLPLQSGSNHILNMMRRRYSSELFASRVEFIKEVIPHAFIGVDVIVGFPGEEESHFMESYSLLENLEVSYLHIFPYSKRLNTVAALLPNQVNSATKRERVVRLKKLSDSLNLAFVEKNRGRRELVLFERGREGGSMYGYSRNYIRVEREYNPNLIGEIVEVIL